MTDLQAAKKAYRVARELLMEEAWPDVAVLCEYQEKVESYIEALEAECGRLTHREAALIRCWKSFCPPRSSSEMRRAMDDLRRCDNEQSTIDKAKQ